VGTVLKTLLVMAVAGWGVWQTYLWWEQRQTSSPVYRWHDSTGRVHFGQHPPAGEQAERLELAPGNTFTAPKPSPPPSTKSRQDPPQGKAVRNLALERMGVLEPPADE
jgi:hypothetical protein